MRNVKYGIFIFIAILMSTQALKAYAPMGREFGLGIMVGEPTGITAKFWIDGGKAVALSVGNSYMGKLRIGADYLWHFNAFNSQVVNLYAGPGIAVGIGESGGWWYQNKNKTWYKEDDDIGFGVRGVFGLNIAPRNTPLEFFGEVGLMIGILPANYTNTEGSIGVRFYF